MPELLKIKDKSACRFDLIALGEVMLRLDPGASRVHMVPAGGVSLKTAADFIRAGAMALGVGADLVDLQAIRDGKASVVTERAREFVRIVKEARSQAPPS